MKKLLNATLFATVAVSMLAATGCDDPEDPTVEDRAGDLTVIVDGVRYEPEEMEEFEGIDLHYVLDADAQAEEVIYAFTSREDQFDFIKEREPAILAQEAQQLQFRAPLTYSKFYDWVDYDEMFGKLKKGQSIANLASHPDYNDNDISSVKCRANAYTWLYDGTNFSGSSLYCRNINVPDLSVHGWNARASSIEVTP